ncbi:MAG: Aldehyde dehydrogenase family [Solirubrobacteraceae bacterium]|jgi:aldehyde dehydrogenase (NAD+)|nr:Aldehyde dehydrogenase family [Solirubrobacteraceae bacterium]
MASAGARAPPRRRAAAPPTDTTTLVMSRRRPRGVAGLITPWNFPIAIPL